MPTPVIWKPDNIEKIGGLSPEVIENAPRVEVVGGKKAVRFDGENTGLLLPAIPIAGWKQFTVEMDMFPEAGGGFEQRFFHAGTPTGGRMMIELRSNPDGSWYLDTFLWSAFQKNKPVIDPAKTHPSGRWYTITAIFDGETLSHYIDGVKEGEVKPHFVPLPAGATSLGVRQNKVSWFKGAISEVRFYPEPRVPVAGK